jgi:hypothetical protein
MIIEEWEWDDANLGYLRRCGAGRRQVLQVAGERPRFRRNRRGRSASHLMIGPDFGGAMWTFCITPVSGRPGVWRAFNVWQASDEERRWYEKQG